MARKPRIISPTSVYHIMNRGVGKMTIFSDLQDCRKYINTVYETKKTESI